MRLAYLCDISALSLAVMGDEHLHELHEAGVNTALVVRGQWPTSLSAIFVKPDGSRTLVNYGGGHDLPIGAKFHHRLSLPSAS